MTLTEFLFSDIRFHVDFIVILLTCNNFSSRSDINFFSLWMTTTFNKFQFLFKLSMKIRISSNIFLIIIYCMSFLFHAPQQISSIYLDYPNHIIFKSSFHFQFNLIYLMCIHVCVFWLVVSLTFGRYINIFCSENCAAHFYLSFENLKEKK